MMYLSNLFESNTLLTIVILSADDVIAASLNSFVLKRVLFINSLFPLADIIPKRGELPENSAVLFSNRLFLIVKFPFSLLISPLKTGCAEEVYRTSLFVTVMLSRITAALASLNNIVEIS